MKRILFIVLWGIFFACLPILILIVAAVLMSFGRGNPLAEALTIVAGIAVPIFGIYGLIYGFRGKLPGTKVVSRR